MALFIRKLCFILAIVFSLGALPACSNAEGAGQNGDNSENAAGSGKYDIFSDTEQILTVEEKDLKGVLNSVQFYRGEPVMLSVESNRTEGRETANVYLYDSGEGARLVAAELPYEVYRGSGFLDEEGCYYSINRKTTPSTAITKYDSSGKEIYTVERNMYRVQMCSLADGKIALLYRDSDTNSNVLALLDMATGGISEMKLKDTNEASHHIENNAWLGTDGKNLYLLNQYGISCVDIEKEKIAVQMSFSDSSYDLSSGASEGDIYRSIKTFRVSEDGDVEILLGKMLSASQAASQSIPPGTVWLETLQKREIAGDKTFLTLRGGWEWGMGDGLKGRIAEFNSKSRDYYVLVEEPENEAYFEDYINRTMIELGTGKGPDILYGELILGDSLYSLIEKRILEDLSPYMERSGMKRGDYFPMAFGNELNDGRVYRICIEAMALNQVVDSSLIEDVDNVDIDVFLDALLTLGDEAVYWEYSDSYDLLQSFLEGSENLWGMVDWESSTCNFNSDRFAKLLQVAKNLGDSGKKSYAPASDIISDMSFYSSTNQRSRLSKSQIILGLPFDDGFHGKVRAFENLSINANSPNKEGAWEFLSYLLSQEAQETQSLPVHRGAFAVVAKEEMKKNSLYKNAPVTQEAVDELEAYLMEDVRLPSLRVQPLIDIIKEEAKDYFDGIKDIGQVRDVVSNRVQLYLDEKH